MKDYDFKCLNDKEFENLVTDLLSAKYGVVVERFKSGKDGGVDGRYFLSGGEEVIVQCKHYLKSGYKALLKILVEEEYAKITKINPKKYILVTSLELSRIQKKEIKKCFSPYIENENDVFGAEDLNDLLDKNKSIEERHYKL